MSWEEKTGGVLVELPLGDAASNFSLEKAVCSHGLFMMAPNRWDPHWKTLRRPLRLNPDGDETSLMVHISHPTHSADALHLRVFGTHALSPQQQQSLLSQVRRMLRLSEEENRRVNEFHELHKEAKGRGFGRVFRSPTLFEDMVKCILLCNCQWSRTLSMAQALCELQSELQHPLSSAANAMAENGTISSCQTTEMKHFVPKTPAGKESKRRLGVRKCSMNLESRYAGVLAVEEAENKTSSAEISECSQETGKLTPTFTSADVKEDFLQKRDSWQTSTSDLLPLQGPEGKPDSSCVPDLQTIVETEGCAGTAIGNFPSPRELAGLDVKFLARRCSLGYRAARVINLAQQVIEGRILLTELEYAYDTLILSNYDKLAEKLRAIDGFGPFTCANVLMCMGFYHVIPTDSETIRHLKQVHAKSSTIQTVQGDVEKIYGKYAPFQFLAYWSEIWHFYEEWFGNLSEMHHSSYKLITAANMRPKTNRSKRMKLSPKDMNDGCTKGIEA
ncbi:UNVERIFIED_CONTAM: hypothetical protein Slati_0792600 [Sesamum latifolium]|uniref:HhH-GPD domain-containing protein n=1 Tax=Sesamum latifolium TaxID=2727402 RepID=A0AAW2XK60_9LAMI